MKGFTLLELLVTIALLAGLMALGASRLGDPLSDQAIGRARRALEESRNDALASGKVVRLPCARLEGALRSGDIQLRCWRLDAAVALDTIDFYPDGSANGAAIVMRSRQKEQVLGVDWLTGVAYEKTEFSQ